MDHSFVTGRVTVRMKFSDYVSDGTGRFFRFSRRSEAKLTHCEYDSTLDGLKTVTDVWQRPVENNVHGVVEISLLSKFQQRLLFNTFKIELTLFTHM